jgi:hypothetical protein
MKRVQGMVRDDDYGSWFSDYLDRAFDIMIGKAIYPNERR